MATDDSQAACYTDSILLRVVADQLKNSVRVKVNSTKIQKLIARQGDEMKGVLTVLIGVLLLAGCMSISGQGGDGGASGRVSTSIPF